MGVFSNYYLSIFKITKGDSSFKRSGRQIAEVKAGVLASELGTAKKTVPSDAREPVDAYSFCHLAAQRLPHKQEAAQLRRLRLVHFKHQIRFKH